MTIPVDEVIAVEDPLMSFLQRYHRLALQVLRLFDDLRGVEGREVTLCTLLLLEEGVDLQLRPCQVAAFCSVTQRPPKPPPQNTLYQIRIVARTHIDLVNCLRL